MIALDANVLIAHLDQGHPRHDAATSLLLDNAKYGFAMSVLTVAESIVRRTQDESDGLALTEVVRMGIAVRPIPADRARQLVSLRATTGLKMPDVVVLTVALDCGQLATLDAQLAKVATAHGVQIVMPS